MTERLVDTIRHGEGELDLPKCDAANPPPGEIGILLYGATSPGVELLAHDQLEVPNAAAFDVPLVHLGDSIGTRAELLDDIPGHEVAPHIPSQFTQDLRPQSTIEELTIRRLVPGGGG